MNQFSRSMGILLAAMLASACGSSSRTSQVTDSIAPGTLAVDPPFRIASVDAPTFAAQLGATTAGAGLLQIAGAPACGIDFYYVKFWTMGAANEPTESSGALMVPTGGSGCSGPRPVVLYAHGTHFNKALNIADITDPTNTEGALIAATFAAHGFIVVAPNYAGYDISTLGYHPFLNAAQQSGEMLNILAAARKALPHTLTASTGDNGQLFVTGYSEGGHVAMATERALQAAGTPVTAAAPMSGPYALEAFLDEVFFGFVNLGATEFSPLLTTSYQHAYGNIYMATTDIYSAAYASGIDTLLPSTTSVGTLIANGLLPQTAEFDSSTPTTVYGQPLPPALVAALAVTTNPPLGPLAFGPSYLLNNDFRASYVVDAAGNPDGAFPTPITGVPVAATAPMQTFRLAAYLNDLRNPAWAPLSPTLLCGGANDPTVFFQVNTGTMASFWSGLPAGAVTILNIDNATPAAQDPFAPLELGFVGEQAQLLAFYETAAGGGPATAAAQLAAGYHGAVAPFCTVAARAFFSNFL